jgi:hypothetical protein
VSIGLSVIAFTLIIVCFACMTDPNTDYDNPWKSIIELYFRDFIQFFFPWIEPEIDWSRAVKFLDKELQKIVRDGSTVKRYADKLVEVYRLDGQALLVLCHIEVQNQYEKVFPARVYTYNYRLRDRYDRDVASLVILGDESLTWRPMSFQADLWGCSVDFVFPVVKLLDYAARWEELAASRNPFAVVVMAHLKAKETTNQPVARKDWKYHLTTMLYDKGYGEQDIMELYQFLDWLMNLPEDLERQFQVELAQFEEARSMKYVTTIERMGIERGREEGRREIVLNLLNKQMTVPQIAAMLDMPIEEVESFANRAVQSNQDV